MKKSGSRIPRIELEDMGPTVDFVLRRTKLASDDLYKRSLKVPKTATVSTILSFCGKNLNALKSCCNYPKI